jgi:hypothetical protein
MGSPFRDIAGHGTDCPGDRLPAVPQLLHPETTALKWHFPQENATLLNAGKGT